MDTKGRSYTKRGPGRRHRYLFVDPVTKKLRVNAYLSGAKLRRAALERKLGM